MNRRQYLAGSLGSLSLAGRIASPGDLITTLAVNEDNSSHSVTVWAVQGEHLAVPNTVDVASKDFEELGQMPWNEAQYRVTVLVDEEFALADEFRSGAWFHHLDVIIDGDESVELNRARAG